MSEPIIGAIYRCVNKGLVPYDCLVEVTNFDNADVYYTYVELTNEVKRVHHREVGGTNSVSFDNFQKHFVLEVDPTLEEIPPKEIELTPVTFNDLFH